MPGYDSESREEFDVDVSLRRAELHVKEILAFLMPNWVSNAAFAALPNCADKAGFTVCRTLNANAAHCILWPCHLG